MNYETEFKKFIDEHINRLQSDVESLRIARDLMFGPEDAPEPVVKKARKKKAKPVKEKKAKPEKKAKVKEPKEKNEVKKRGPRGPYKIKSTGANPEIPRAVKKVRVPNEDDFDPAVHFDPRKDQ
jgi:hypothetical protein